MLTQWQKAPIDQYLSDLKVFYQDSSKGYFQTSNIADKLTAEEKKYLNETIQLEEITKADKRITLNKLFQDKEKFNFARYILTTLCIEVEVNALDEEGKSVFQLMLENLEDPKNGFAYHYLLYLYMRGYKSIKQDELYLADFYRNRMKSEQHFEMWCMARICYKLNNVLKIEEAFHKEKVLLTILSFKQGKPVGFNYPNLLGIANNAIQHYRKQGDLLFHAMKHYQVYNIIKQRDKKGTFKLKEQDFYNFKPIQDVEFNALAYEIFPELKPIS